MSIALARKYRPRTFADVAVQSHVASTLQGAIARGRVAHGYLLCGPRGVGKTTLARVLAMALNCERRGLNDAQRDGAEAAGRSASDATLARAAGEPCGECSSCQRIWSGAASLDVVEIDAASNRGVDDARELRERAMYAPSGEDRYKVYIVDEAHMLTREAWNALLKVLEEPPPRVVFVFATTEPQKIAQSAAPVLSRLQRFDFRRIGAGEVRARLERVLGEEGIGADAEALGMLARAADGSMRDAMSLTDQVLSAGDGRVTALRVREALGLVPEDEYLALLDLIAERRAGDVFAVVARLADAGIDFGGFLAGLGDMLRAQLAVCLGGTATEVSERAREHLTAGSARFAAGDVLRMLQLLAELEPRFRKSGQQQLLLETLLVRFALLDRAVSLEDVLRGLGSGGAGSAAAGQGSSRASAPAPPPSRDARGAGAAGREAQSAAAPERPMPGSVPVERELSPTSLGRTAGAHGSTREPADLHAPFEGPPLDDTPHPADMVDAGRASPPAAAAPPRPERQRGGAAPGTATAAPDVNAIADVWDRVVATVRAGGKTMLATALEHASPAAVNAQGQVTVELDDPNEFYAQSIESGRADLLAALRAELPGVSRVELRGGTVASPARMKRISDDDIRSARLAKLRKHDAVLDAAIEALDLDVVD